LNNLGNVDLTERAFDQMKEMMIWNRIYRDILGIHKMLPEDRKMVAGARMLLSAGGTSLPLNESHQEHIRSSCFYL
jgi:hypothetical protein